VIFIKAFGGLHRFISFIIIKPHAARKIDVIANDVTKLKGEKLMGAGGGTEVNARIKITLTGNRLCPSTFIIFFLAPVPPPVIAIFGRVPVVIK
jgi:hypothetical protein